MLFNSALFLFLFVPGTLLLFFALQDRPGPYRVGLMLAASLFFYAWWNPPYLFLLLPSILANFLLARMLEERSSRALLGLGVALNLGLIGVFKYGDFLIGTVGAAVGADAMPRLGLLLPLGISFFTFQQIAYLVDVRRGQKAEPSVLRYALFVSFFPQLVAGPIVRYRSLGPQIAVLEGHRLSAADLIPGASIFILGLFKKVVIADSLAPFAAAAFDGPGGPTADFLTAWGGLLAYSFQIYFDFSAYSDMAIGLARLFGIVLPVNFASPYKATSIIDFWRRWHMTLSRFITDYLYIPLGGNRFGYRRQAAAIAVTMFLGGLWHGAAWTFVVWGIGHGLCIVAAHLWRRVAGRRQSTAWGRVLGWLATFTAVTLLWTLFRAHSLADAVALFKVLGGANGIAVPEGIVARLGALGAGLAGLGVQAVHVTPLPLVFNAAWIMALLPLVLLIPCTGQVFRRFGGDADGWDTVARLGDTALAWRPSQGWAAYLGVLLALALLSLADPSEFLYFNF